MLLTYYALRALSEEWDSLLRGATIGEVYTQSKAELALALYADTQEQSIFVRFSSPIRCLYRRDGHSRARRNVATVLKDAIGSTINGVRIADRDRHLYVDLTGGRYLQIVPFGPRPNVLLCDSGHRVIDAFLHADEHAGQPAPTPRPAPSVASYDAFIARWKGSGATMEQNTARAFPLFDRELAREALIRAGEDPHATGTESVERIERIWQSCLALEQRLTTPEPCVYRNAVGALHFSLLPLLQAPNEPERRFQTVDEAAERFVRAFLSEHAFRSRYDPLVRALTAVHERQQRTLEQMKQAMSSGSRADRYEHWAHLLMAQPHLVPQGAEEVEVPDVFAPGEHVRIPLNPEWTPVRNAEALYDKARQSRAARDHAERRLKQAEEDQTRVGDALVVIKELDQWQELKQFEIDYADLLERLAIHGSRPEQAGPRFRQFDLRGGYQVLVGKNAAQNEALTFRHAARHDFWLHARGVAGSHVILRARGRNDEPPRDVREAAASIAAYYSKASGSELVPVIITPRKYVRKPRKSLPGSVLVEREEVLIVPPRLPEAE